MSGSQLDQICYGSHLCHADHVCTSNSGSFSQQGRSLFGAASPRETEVHQSLSRPELANWYQQEQGQEV